MLSFPQLAASIRGVRPFGVAAFTFTPASSSRLAMLSWPMQAAYMSGVHPPRFFLSRSTSRLDTNTELSVGGSQRVTEMKISRCLFDFQGRESIFVVFSVILVTLHSVLLLLRLYCITTTILVVLRLLCHTTLFSYYFNSSFIITTLLCIIATSFLYRYYLSYYHNFVLDFVLISLCLVNF